jgi:ABC-type phosphate/phosphonate transport system ATPase subunit
MNTITKLLKQYSDNSKAQDAIRLIVHTDHSVFLTGKAGTGRSWLLKALTPCLTKKHIILAPTEVAALQVGGENIHTFFGFEWRAFMPNDKELPPLPPNKVELLEDF